MTVQNLTMRVTARGSAARMKAAKTAKIILTDDSSQQVLHKGEYVFAKAGKIFKYTEVERGKDLLRPARLEEVVPNLEVYYMTNPYKVNKFYLISFSHLVEWESIKEFIRERRIYVKTAFDKSAIKSSESNTIGTSTFAKQKERGGNARTLFDA